MNNSSSAAHGDMGRVLSDIITKFLQVQCADLNYVTPSANFHSCCLVKEFLARHGFAITDSGSITEIQASI